MDKKVLALLNSAHGALVLALAEAEQVYAAIDKATDEALSGNDDDLMDTMLAALSEAEDDVQSCQEALDAVSEAKERG